MAIGNLNQLDEHVRDELEKLVKKSHTMLQRRVTATADEIASLYETDGQDFGARLISRIKNAGGVSFTDFSNPQSAIWNTMDPEMPNTLANLFLSRLLTIVSGLVPGTPTLEVQPRTPGAAYMAENQNLISEFVCDHGRLEDAMSRAALLGMTQPYFGVYMDIRDEEKHPVDKVRFEAVEADRCGYEPYLRRFDYRVRDAQYGDLPEDIRENFEASQSSPAPPDWMPCEILEVYHNGFRHGLKGLKKIKRPQTPCSYWVLPIGDMTQHRRRRTLAIGTYCGTRVLPAQPLHVDSFLQPAPNADCGPAECLSWIPMMRAITQVMDQIKRHVETQNNITLFEGGSVERDQIQSILDAPPGRRVFLEVQPQDTGRGVNAVMRPVELDSVLNEYLAVLNTYISLFDDLTGVSPMDRGMAQNPEKSATEAAAITQNANRRNKARLEVVSKAFGAMARAHHGFQRQLYGKKIEIPTSSGLVHNIVVPDPELATFAFRVDPVDLEHISRRGQIESNLTFMREATQTLANFRGAIPPVVRELLRRTGKALGFQDVDMFLQQPSTEMGPQERLMEYMLRGDVSMAIPTFETDDSELFFGFYQNLISDEAEVSEMDPRLVERLVEAMSFYQKAGARSQAAQMARMADGSRMGMPGEMPGAPGVAPGVAAAPLQIPGLNPR